MKTICIPIYSLLLLLVGVVGVVDGRAAIPCANLATLKPASVTTTVANVVMAGAFMLPGRPAVQPNQPFRDLPSFCRVAATLKPSGDSDIKIEVWLPTENWNGKFQAVGNGAWTGVIAYPAMAEALRHGYATSSTDTGHTGGSASFALGHPEKVIDFAYRSEHEMTVAAKHFITSFYGSAPKYSYWNGCSAGGRQALKEAQMFPGDFDGIIAGAPGLDWSGRSAQAATVAQRLQDETARLAPAQLQMLHEAVVQRCDPMDGLKDGLISNPASCKFDPAVLECTRGGGVVCLTASQVETARVITSPLVNSKTKREIPGLAWGSELGWTDLGWSASARATGFDHFRYLIFQDPAWNLQKFNAASDVPRLEEGESGSIDAQEANLKPFFERGGKLIQYHGWSDPQISPLASTTYFQRVLTAVGGANKAMDSYRLFMVPGMAHCGGGEGPNSFDKMSPLEQWIEKGKAPDQIVASHLKDGKVDRSRPLCPYPQIAQYKGNGSIDDAASFVCK